MSDSHKGKGLGKDNPMFGRKHTEEEKKKMSERMKGKFVGKNHPFYGRHHTEEAKRNQSEKMKGRKPWNTGKPLSKATKRKISKAMNGGKKS